MTTSQLNAGGESPLRQVRQHPYAGSTISLEPRIGRECFLKRNLPAEYVLIEGIGHLRLLEWREKSYRVECHSPPCLMRMSIHKIEGHDETGVRVDLQYRLFSRSSSSVSTAGMIRSPKIFRARASKSGHSTGFFTGSSGTIRPSTLSRSRNSTVSPALSQALS